MKVIAAKGVKCPKEGNPREYIIDSEPVDVPDDSTYYRRLIADGSLVEYRSNTSYTTNDSEKKGGKK